MLQTELTTPEELVAFGRDLARQLPDFAVLALIGELGAGKTTLMKGFAEGWEVAEPAEVTSPTYTLVHEYRRGERSLLHLDLYRVETAAQLATLGLDDIWSPPRPGERKCVAVEWGERVEGQLPRPYYRVRISSPSPERRRVEVEKL